MDLNQNIQAINNKFSCNDYYMANSPGKLKVNAHRSNSTIDHIFATAQKAYWATRVRLTRKPKLIQPQITALKFLYADYPQLRSIFFRRAHKATAGAFFEAGKNNPLRIVLMPTQRTEINFLLNNKTTVHLNERHVKSLIGIDVTHRSNIMKVFGMLHEFGHGMQAVTSPQEMRLHIESFDRLVKRLGNWKTPEKIDLAFKASKAHPAEKYADEFAVSFLTKYWENIFPDIERPTKLLIPGK
ncbi:MAG TPA: hypothetical protein VJG83_00080 [archaeon]|nr:hypothetical protein [archaeon]